MGSSSHEIIQPYCISTPMQFGASTWTPVGQPQDYHKLGDLSVLWTSKLQPTVSLSTTGAEYHVLSEAAKDIVYLIELFTKIGEFADQPTSISSNNESCIRLVNNPILH